MRLKALLGIVVFVLLLTHCNQPETVLSTTGTARIARNYPKVDGSTSALPLQVTLACKIFDVPCVWQESPFERTRALLPDPSFEGSPQSVQRIFDTQHAGTHGSYTNLIDGEADFILVARSPSEDELQAAQKVGITLDAQAIALDAFVFLVNVANPVDDLTLETIRDVYTGKIAHWTELGTGAKPGGDAEDRIQPYQRNRNSGSQELMEALVMQDVPMIDSPDMMLPSMMGPINIISEDPLGIGYSVYYYAAFIFPAEQVKLIGIDGVTPTSEHIADRAYSLTTEVYAVIREDMPKDSTAVLLRDWLLTEGGQAVIEESGYVPIR